MRRQALKKLYDGRVYTCAGSLPICVRANSAEEAERYFKAVLSGTIIESVKLAIPDRPAVTVQTPEPEEV